MRRPIRSVLAVVLLLQVAASCSRGPEPAPEPVQHLLFEDLALPDSYWETREGQPVRQRAIHWQVVYSSGNEVPTGPPGVTQPCKGVSLAWRNWSHEGDPIASPELSQSICGYADEETAARTFAGTDLAGALGSNDFGIFPYTFGGPVIEGHEHEIFPSPAQAPQLLAADFEFACLTGDARTICYDWFYRGVYGPVVMHITLFGGANSFEDFLAAVRVIDGDLGSAVSGGA